MQKMSEKGLGKRAIQPSFLLYKDYDRDWVSVVMPLLAQFFAGAGPGHTYQFFQAEIDANRKERFVMIPVYIG